MKHAVTYCLIVFLLSPLWLMAQDEGGPSDEELAKKVQNPIASMYSLPLQNNTTFGVGPDNKVSNTLNVQPVIPIGLGSKVNMIARTIIPISTVPNYSETNAPGTTGLGDITLSLFFTPTKETKWIWGVGPVIDFPTASNDLVGFGELNMGPSVILIQFNGKWVYGFTANNAWSVANDHVNKLYLQYFINYNLPKALFISWQPIVTANWNAPEGEKWLVPFGANIGKVVRWGKQPINLQAGAYYNAVRPENAGDWQTRLMISLLFPK